MECNLECSNIITILNTNGTSYFTTLYKTCSLQIQHITPSYKNHLKKLEINSYYEL